MIDKAHKMSVVYFLGRCSKRLLEANEQRFNRKITQFIFIDNNFKRKRILYIMEMHTVLYINDLPRASTLTEPLLFADKNSIFYHTLIPATWKMCLIMSYQILMFG